MRKKVGSATGAGTSAYRTAGLYTPPHRTPASLQLGRTARTRQAAAELLPQGRLLEIEDSCTLIAEDQPKALSPALRTFVAERAGGGF
jgi:hypothetical protein